MKIGRYSTHVCRLAAFGIVAFFASSVGLADSGDTIYACAKKNSGNLRVVSAPGQCLKSEYEVSWDSGEDVSQRINELLARVAAIESALGVINEAPIVNAGEDQAILWSMTADLSATAEDDGLLQPLTYWWDSISGSGTVSFTNPDALMTGVSFSVPDTYELGLSVDDGAVTVTDTLQIIVHPDNTAPTIIVDDPQVVAAERLMVNGQWTLRCNDVDLAAAATDDGLPYPLTFDWQVVTTSSPTYKTEVITSFSDEPNDSIDWPFNIATKPRGVTVYKDELPVRIYAYLGLSVSDGYHDADASLYVHCDAGASDPPIVDAGDDIVATGRQTDSYGSYVCEGIPLAGFAEDDGLPEPLMTSWGTYHIPSIPPGWRWTATTNDSAALNTTARIYIYHDYSYSPPPDPVTFTFALRADDGYFDQTDTVNVTCGTN